MSCEVGYTAERVCSILTDFGVEKEAWFTPGMDPQDAPTDTDDANLLFKFNLPLPDADHALHHAPSHSTECFFWSFATKNQCSFHH